MRTATLAGILGWAGVVTTGSTWAATEDPFMVLTPVRLSQHQSEVPASVTVIDRELIRASGVRELADLFRLVPGMISLDADGNVPTVSYHGTSARDTRRMQVLVDGRSVYQPALPRVQWNDLPLQLEDIERIEVTRGPSVSVWGANAFTGIINIVTRHPDDVVDGQIQVSGGNNGIGDLALTGAHHWQGGGLRWSLSTQGDDGYDRTQPANGHDAHDARRSWQANLRLARQWGAGQLELMAGGSTSRLERPPENDQLLVMQLDDLPEERNQQLFLQARYLHPFSARHQLRLQGFLQWSRMETPMPFCARDPVTGQIGPGGALLVSRELRELFEASGRDLDALQAAMATDPALIQRYVTLMNSGAPAFCGDLDIGMREQRLDLELQDTWQPHDRVRLVSGINLRQDGGRSHFYGSRTHYNDSHTLFANLELNPWRSLWFNLGGLYQSDDINGDQWSPRAAVIFKPFEGHSLRWVYSSAVRNVSLYERHANFDVTVRPDRPFWQQQSQTLLGWERPRLFLIQTAPDGTLEPERIRSREVGWFFQRGTFSTDWRLFREELDDVISGAMTMTASQLANVDHIRHEGVEGQLDWRPHWRHLLRLTVARIDSESSASVERRLAARDSGSALWAAQWGEHWQTALSWHEHRVLNRRAYRLATVQLGRQHGLGRHRLEWQVRAEHLLSGGPVVYADNRRRHPVQYWFTIRVRY